IHTRYACLDSLNRHNCLHQHNLVCKLYLYKHPVREGEFVAILVWFLGVMNFIVSVNNIEWFFRLLFSGKNSKSMCMV
ncbi:MAG TPA: hypothetical protein EYP03_02480, partial [Aquificae bacterium]|nr:hypothetical protein [Aquificota bacterium]